jgi:hypothetical protein
MGEAQKKEEPPIVPVGPGAEGLPEARHAADEDEELEQGDEREPEQDTRIGQSDEDEPPERRKETAKERRERQKKARARDRLERDFLLKRNEELERWKSQQDQRLAQVETRTTRSEVADIDARIQTLESQINSATAIEFETAKKDNRADFLEARRIADGLRRDLAQLQSSRDEIVRREKTARAEPRVETSAQPLPDPMLVNHAQRWAREHPWFDVHSADEDSVIVRAIDEALSAEGYDGRSADYWDELTRRVKRRLPERFKANGRTRREDDDVDDEDIDESPRRTSGPKFSSGGRERSLRKGEVYVSADRKQAMKDAGVWEDPVLRQRMLKRYATWDAENASTKY